MDTTNTDSTRHADGAKPGLARADGSASVDIVAMMDRFYSGTDSSHKPEDNAQNRDFLAGYAEGLVTTDTTLSIGREWSDRGEPGARDQSFKEWKRGMWAAHLGRTTQRSSQNDQAEGRA